MANTITVKHSCEWQSIFDQLQNLNIYGGVASDEKFMSMLRELDRYAANMLHIPKGYAIRDMYVICECEIDDFGL